MAQFCSQRPFNDDPQPYILKYGIAPMRVDEGATLGFYDNYIHSPRAQYERPQTNPTSELLVYFRGFLGDRTGEDFRQEALSLIETLDDVEGYTREEIAHARRVLELLSWSGSSPSRDVAAESEREHRGALPNLDCPACCPELHDACGCTRPRCAPHWLEHGLNSAERDAKQNPDKYLLQSGGSV